MGQTVAVVLAGGRGTRVGAPTNKVLLDLAGIPILVRSVLAFDRHPAVDSVLVVAHAEELATVQALVGDVELVAGGSLRPDSERAALEALRERIDRGAVSTVLLHDAARPLVSAALITAVVEASERVGGAIPGVEVLGLLHAADRTPLSGPAVRAQTPQGFAAPVLLAAYDAAHADGFHGTDTASYLERYGAPVQVVPGEPDNLKVTWPSDLARAERILAGHRG